MTTRRLTMRVTHIGTAIVLIAVVSLPFLREHLPARPKGSVPSRANGATYNPNADAGASDSHGRWREYDDSRLRSQLLLDAGDLTRAESECRRSLELSPRINGEIMGPATEIMGLIRLRQGNNREAIEWFTRGNRHIVGDAPNVNLTIAYCRLGDLPNATRHFSNGSVRHGWDHRGGLNANDLPGMKSLITLEASALLGRGINSAAEDRHQDALADFLAAERLVPSNPIIAFNLGEIYLALHDGANALPRYRVASRSQTPAVRQLTEERIKGIESWFRIHPEAAVPPGGRP